MPGARQARWKPSRSARTDHLQMTDFLLTLERMTNPERYQPTPEETAKAEAAMTPEQKAASEERAAFKYQERAPFSDEIGKSFIETAERRQPTDEERRNMDQDMADLSQMTVGSDTRWSIDGARNISLMRGDYIGVHKDVDISIEAEDLSKLDASLAKDGYGLFISYPKDAANPHGQKIIERMGASGLARHEGGDAVIMAIESNGKLRETKGLNAIDVHVVKRDAEGHPVGPEGNNTLPDKWYEPQPTSYQGHELNISHPAKVAYFKLRQDRPYDLMDLKPLVESGKLTDEDIQDVEEAVENDFASRRQKGERIVSEMAARLKPEMGMEDIRKAIAENPYMTKKLAGTTDPAERRKMEAAIRSIAKSLADPRERSVEKFRDTLFSTFGVAEAEAKMRDKVRQLRAWRENGDKMDEARRQLDAAE